MADVAVSTRANSNHTERDRAAEQEPRTSGVTVVIPFFNAMRYLPHTAPGVIAAARHTGGVEIIYVDNGSTDGSVEYLRSLAADCVRVLSLTGRTIGGMRNWGAQQGTGEYLSFIDADCGIEVDYFDVAMATLRETGAAATGCEYDVRPRPTWIENALRDMHFMGHDRYVRYINAGNFFIRRAAFDAVGGFRSDLQTDEDSDIGRRLTDARLPLYECTRVRAVHYGNPNSLADHYRRTVWHSLGMFASVRHGSMDRPTAMLALHLVATAAGVAFLVFGPVPLPGRIGVALLLQSLAPGATVVYRMVQTKRAPRLHHALLVYWIYYWARVHALMLITFRRDGEYRR